MGGALALAQGAHAVPIVPDVHSITFPLMGSAHELGYTFQYVFTIPLS